MLLAPQMRDQKRLGIVRTMSRRSSVDSNQVGASCRLHQGRGPGTLREVNTGRLLPLLAGSLVDCCLSWVQDDFLPLPKYAIRSGPRETVYHNPNKVHIAVVTCGSLCPGINNVVQSIVRKVRGSGDWLAGAGMELWTWFFWDLAMSIPTACCRPGITACPPTTSLASDTASKVCPRSRPRHLCWVKGMLLQGHCCTHGFKGFE